MQALDPLARRVTDTIARALTPDKIIVFGSRASRTPRPDSDLDILVLYSGPKQSRTVQLDIRRLFPSPDFSMDLWVMTPSEFETQKSVPNSLAREVYERGVVCYG